MKLNLFTFSMCLFLLFGAWKIVGLNYEYEYNISSIKNDVVIVSDQIRNGDKILSAEQQADLLIVVSSRSVSEIYLNALNLICIMLIVLSVINGVVGYRFGIKVMEK
jgi:hypothetical protein